MPGIFLFGRRWMAASDGLVFTFGTSVLLRVAWFILISIIFGIHSEILKTEDSIPVSETEECKGKLNIYLLGYITLLAVISIIECLLCFTSSRGRIFEVHKRQAVVPLLYVRFALFVIELTWQMLGFVWISSDQVLEHCQSMPTKRLAQGVVIFNFLFMIGIFVVVYFAFDSAGRLWPKMQSSGDRKSRYGAIDSQIRTHYEKKWEKSLRALFCCTKKESSMENVFAFVSSLLSDYFQEYLDLVPSDIVAGLILLRRRQKVMESRNISRFLSESQGKGEIAAVGKKKTSRCVHRYQKTGSAKSFNFSNAFDAKILEDVSHFSSYALAIYGWPFYLYDRILCGVCNLCCKIRCCAGCCRPSQKEFLLIDDNCCECNIEATKLFLKDRNHDIIYVSYKDEVYQPPFFVALDHKKKAVVISCRGTLSLKDVLTDVMVEEERIPVDGGHPNWLGHKGMIQSAQYVLDILTREEILERAFSSNSDLDTQSYRLTIVGHSLGAGVASILAFLLRPKYPDLICYAYSAVGATFNYDASKYARDFIYSIVVGKDVISRLNLHTLDELRYMVIQLLHMTDLPKWKIMRGCLCQCMLCCQATGRRSHEDYIDYEFHDIPEYEPPSPKRYYMGGKVIHIVKTQSIYPKYFGEKKAVYEAVWADVEDFQSILISNLMWKDHVPDTVKTALESCLSQRPSSHENGAANEPEKPKGNLKKDEKAILPEEKIRLLDDGEEEDILTITESKEEREETIVEADLSGTDDVIKNDVTHTTEVCVEIHYNQGTEDQCPSANEDMIEIKPEGGLENTIIKTDSERETKSESQNEVLLEQGKTVDSFEFIVSTNHIESSLGDEAEGREAFEVIDIVVKNGDTVKDGDELSYTERKEDESEAQSEVEAKVCLEAESLGEVQKGGEGGSLDEVKVGDHAEDEASQEVEQKPEINGVGTDYRDVLESKNVGIGNDVIPVSEIISSTDVESVDKTEIEGIPVSETNDDVNHGDEASSEVEDALGEDKDPAEVSSLPEVKPELKGPDQFIVVATESEDPVEARKEGQGENSVEECSENIVVEVKPILEVRNETIVTIETTTTTTTKSEDVSDFIVLENDTCAETGNEENSSKEEKETTVVDVKVITECSADIHEEIA